MGLVVAILLLAGGAVTATKVSFRYLHAPALEADGGGWTPPDNAHVRFVSAGPYSASIVPPRPGHAQTFLVNGYNPSSVTQTILGIPHAKEFANPRLTGEPEHVTIATGPDYLDLSSAPHRRGPVAIPPHAGFELRVTQDTGHIWSHCRAEYWNDFQLRVRVGAFTRTEDLDLSNDIFELEEPGKNCT